MALVDLVGSPTPTDTAVEQLKKLTKESYVFLRQRCAQMSMILWKNPQGVPPEQILAALGEDAALLLTLAEEIVKLAALLGDTTARVCPVEFQYEKTKDGVQVSKQTA